VTCNREGLSLHSDGAAVRTHCGGCCANTFGECCPRSISGYFGRCIWGFAKERTGTD